MTATLPKVGEILRVLVDVPTLWSDVRLIPAGTLGRVAKLYSGDDAAIEVVLELAGGKELRTTFFENELGQIIEVVP